MQAALPPTERALAARGVPWYDVPDVCAGWALALLGDTPRVKKGCGHWAGEGLQVGCTLCRHSVVTLSSLCRAALEAASGGGHGAPLRPPAPPRQPQALQWMKVMQTSWRAWEVETLRCVRGWAPPEKYKGL